MRFLQAGAAPRLWGHETSRRWRGVRLLGPLFRLPPRPRRWWGTVLGRDVQWEPCLPTNSRPTRPRKDRHPVKGQVSTTTHFNKMKITPRSMTASPSSPKSTHRIGSKKPHRQGSTKNVNWECRQALRKSSVEKFILFSPESYPVCLVEVKAVATV